MAAILQLRVKQMIVHSDFETASIRREQANRFDLRLKLIEQFGCQPDSPVGIVSNGAVNYLYFHQHGFPPIDKSLFKTNRSS